MKNNNNTNPDVKMHPLTKTLSIFQLLLPFSYNFNFLILKIIRDLLFQNVLSLLFSALKGGMLRLARISS